MSGGDGSIVVVIAYVDRDLTHTSLRLTGDVAARALNVGTYDGAVGSSKLWPVSLDFAGNGYIWKGAVWISEDSRLFVTDGLTVNGAIYLDRSSTLTADGSFAQTAGYKVMIRADSKFELKDQPSAGWVDRLTYYDGSSFPDGAGRAVFADGEFIVNKDGVTQVSSPPPAPAPSGGSSSGGGSSGPGTPLLRTTAKTADIITPAKMRRLIAQADKNGWDVVRASGSRPMTVEARAWELLPNRGFAARTLAGGAVQVQLAFPKSWKPAEDMNVSGYTAGKEADRVRALFEKWFANPVRVIHLEHAGEFGGPVEIAARADLTGMDLSRLHLYSYDAKTNSYKPIENSNYRIDKNGYLHFVTELAGDMIVSSGQLQRR